jgi:hypothetical protein
MSVAFLVVVSVGAVVSQCVCEECREEFSPGANTYHTADTARVW